MYTNQSRLKTRLRILGIIPILILPIWLGFSSNASAGPRVLAVRGAEAEADRVAFTLKTTVIPTDTKEFANGNTYVRLLQPVQNSDVILVLPPELNANTLMETLIKIRTAKSNGAFSVSVVSPAQLQDLKVKSESGSRIALNLEVLFAEAGASMLREANITRPITQQPRTNASRKTSRAVLYSTTHPALANALSEKSGMPILEKPSKVTASTEVFVVSGGTSRANESFLNSLSSIQYFKSKGAVVQAIYPYLPYARSDKVDIDGVTVTGRLIADLIEVSGASAATFVRAHAPQSQGFFRIANTNLSGRNTINPFLRANNIELVVSPDAGFQKDATLYADELGVPVSIVNKQRDPQSGKAELKGISGPSVEGKRVVVIDDETASGGTLAKVAKLLKELGAREVWAVVTHITGDAKDAVESRELDRLVVTDSVPTEGLDRNRITVLSVADELSTHLRQVMRQKGHSPCNNLDALLRGL